MLISEMQNLLATLYRLDVHADVNDFLVTDQTLLGEIVAGTTPLAEEMLLIRESETDSTAALDVALYIDAKMLRRLLVADPRRNLHEHNLNDFCTVLEGVSHFVYLVWNAIQDKQVTQLELEVQAEIDKYIGARLLLESQSNTELTTNVLSALFETVAYRENLSPERLRRYQQANDFAGRYCFNLQRRFPESRVSAPLIDELRCFYRMPQRDKLSHMQAAQFA